MSVALGSDERSTAIEIERQAETAREHRLRRASLAAIGLYATVTLVLFPDGSPSRSARVAQLALITLAGLIVVVVIRRAPDWSLGPGSLVLGFAMVAAGGGVVAERAFRRMWPTDLIGIGAAVAGVALVILGWRRVLARTRPRWLAVGIALAATGVVIHAAVYPAGWALLATNRGAPPPLSDRTPAEVGLPYSDVRIPSHDGLHLAAWWIAPKNGGAVIVLTGSGSTRDDGLAHARFLARAGYGVLIPDFRGHGDSPGRSMELGWGADRDVSAMITWVLDRPGVMGKVGVLGLSLGAMVAITTAAQDPRIGAIVADGPTARTWADARLTPGMNPLMWESWWMRYHLIEVLAPEPEPIPIVDALRSFEAPVLMISGSSRREAGLVSVYAAAAPDHVTEWAVSDAPHSLALFRVPGEYRRRVLELFGRTLDGAPRPAATDPISR